MKYFATVAGLVAAGLLQGCPVFPLPPACADGGACPAGFVCGTDLYCHGGGGSGTGGTGTGGSTGRTATGGTTNGSSTGGGNSSGSTAGSSGTGGSSSGGTTGGAPCYCPACPASAGGLPLPPVDGGITPRANLVGVIVGGEYLFAIGGQDSCGKDTGLIEVYDTLNHQNGWRHAVDVANVNVPDLNVSNGAIGAQYLSAVGVLNGGNPAGVVTIGGIAGGATNDQTLAIVQYGASWLNEGALPEPIAHAAAVVDANGCVELIGGRSPGDGGIGQTLSSIETLCDPFSAGHVSGAAWSDAGFALLQPISDEAVAQDAAGTTYVLGGQVAAVEYSHYAWSIDPAFTGVSGFPSTQAAHFRGGAAVLGTTLYAVAGSDSLTDGPQTDVESYDLTQGDAGVWVSQSSLSLNLPREGFATFSDGSNIYVVGGVGPGNVIYGNMEVYTSGSSGWVLVP